MVEEQHDEIRKHTRDLILSSKGLNSNQLFKASLGLFKNSKNRLKLLFIVLVGLFLFLKLILFKATSAIEIISDLTVNVNTIIIPVFAIIVTAYAIFQALVSDQTMITLITVNHEDKGSKFKVYNLYFFGVAVSYLFLIILNFLLMFIFKYMPTHWYITFWSKDTNEYISAFLISLYISLVLYFLVEMKSVIYNLFQVFVTHAASNAIKHLNDSDQNNKGQDEKEHSISESKTKKN
ncbi:MULTISPECIES: hypothetical protein [Bacillus]|uniref:hypothetical protein n=1 Tax=Bacillus TaxID=1386 RepID=UPI0022802AA5|nr:MULTISPECIES: hypothetical protein [Bacillus]MCY7913499.1 hypothetical protein [Bacillus haynesii]MCY7926923.1 hypothetical protein [Bacillus haynesii]MCY8774563.1 hypothetical protein [Bacillus haynesii]MCY9220085.1 hypothetical protein [Bacillus licheniformis]MEC0788223.1 hypothetical protein [Bacillus haynesii]